jgi:polysaccharide export outer membrane protein
VPQFPKVHGLIALVAAAALSACATTTPNPDLPQGALSKSQLLVDNAGFVQLPLAGQIKAAGLTVGGLSNAITTSLGGRYLVDPEVSVSVVQPAKRYVSVEGEVKAPGVYEIDTDFTLLSAIARAQSPTDTARLNEVLVFRTINDRRMVARFNLKDIRGGIAPDPEIMNGDVVTIGRSAVRAAWQDILRAAPIFNAFVVLGNN